MQDLPRNEPVLDFGPGSTERADLQRELREQSSRVVEIPLLIGGDRLTPNAPVPFSAPHRHDLILGRRYEGTQEFVDRAIAAALEASAIGVEEASLNVPRSSEERRSFERQLALEDACRDDAESEQDAASVRDRCRL